MQQCFWHGKGSREVEKEWTTGCFIPRSHVTEEISLDNDSLALRGKHKAQPCLGGSFNLLQQGKHTNCFPEQLLTFVVQSSW